MVAQQPTIVGTTNTMAEAIMQDLNHQMPELTEHREAMYNK